MISLKIIQPSFIRTSSPQITMIDFKISRRRFILSLCKSKDEDDKPNNPEDSSPQPKGDVKKQDILAKIAMLQAEKYRLTDYLDERSDYLTKFAEDAITEFDAIGESALKDLDESSARIMENIEKRMQEFEESAELSRQEIAKSDQELADFQDEIAKGRNEGLFFKSMSDKSSPSLTPEEKAKAKQEAEKIKAITKKSAGSKIRRNIYLALISLDVIGIADSLVSSSLQDWNKITFLSLILVGLVSQLIYEQKILSKAEKQNSVTLDKEKE